MERKRNFLFKKRLKRKRRRFHKKSMGTKLFSYMTLGRTSTSTKIVLNLQYGFDSNYQGGYLISYTHGTTSTYIPPLGSAGVPNAGSASAFTFANPNGGASSPGLIPIWFVLGTQQYANSIGSNVLRYKYMRVSGVTVIPECTILPASTAYTAGGAVVPNNVNNAIDTLPDLYFNVHDNIGTYSIDATNTLDDVTDKIPHGFATRSIGSLRFRPRATNDKKPIKRFFKFGSFCYPTVSAFNVVNGSNSWRNYVGLGHWGPTAMFGHSDVYNEQGILPVINGSIIYAWEPVGMTSLQTTNYQNTFTIVGRVELWFHFDWKGQYDFTVPTAQ